MGKISTTEIIGIIAIILVIIALRKQVISKSKIKNDDSDRHENNSMKTNLNNDELIPAN
jgi:uncharacterized membrane protein